MPNGGPHFCANCSHFEATTSKCLLREVAIDLPYRTTCQNFNQPDPTITGPLFAMVSETKNHTGWHDDLPYLDGCRPETVEVTEDTVVRFELGGNPRLTVLRVGDTLVRIRDKAGTTHELPSGADYRRFYSEHTGDS